MRKDRWLWMLVAADVLLAFASMGSELMFQWTLPVALRMYTESGPFPIDGPLDVVRILFWATSISCTLVAWIGLLNRWWFARPLYAFAWASWTLLLLVSGPSVMTPVGAVMSTLNGVVGGAILGLVYFSDLARQFERQSRAPGWMPGAASGTLGG